MGTEEDADYSGFILQAVHKEFAMTGIDEVSLQIGGLKTDVGNLTGSMERLTSTLESHVKEAAAFRGSEAKKNGARDIRVGAIGALVDSHEEMASQINLAHIPDMNKNHEFIRERRERADFWKAFRIKLLEKGMLSVFAVLGLFMLSLVNSGARHALLKYLGLG